MNKTDLIAAVAERAEITKVMSAKVLNAAFDTITDTMVSGEKVAVTGFGVFAPKSRAARMGRNPQTGEAIEIPAHTAYTWKAGKTLKESK